MMPPKTHALPEEELARLVGISKSTWKEHKRAGAPVPKDGDDLQVWIAAYHDWRAQRRRIPGPKPREPRQLEMDWTERRIRALAEEKELQVAILRRLYIARAEVDAQVTRQVLMVRARLAELASKAPLRLWPPDSPEALEMQRILDEEVRSICDSFADGMHNATGDPPERHDGGA